MSSNENFAGFVQDVLATLFFTIQVDKIISAEWVEQDVHVIFASEFFDTGARVNGRCFNDTTPQTNQSSGRNVDLKQNIKNVMKDSTSFVTNKYISYDKYGLVIFTVFPDHLLEEL